MAKTILHKKPRAKPGEIKKWLLNNKAHDGDSCLEWPFAKNKAGYGNCKWAGGYKNAHRVMCELIHGKPPTPDHEAAHLCGRGDSGCVNPRHLCWASKSENNHQKTEHGTQLRGSKQPTSKLKRSEVVRIRSLKGVKSYREIGKMFSISPQQVCKIILRQGWGWLD